jgi:hypothetical protein
VSEAALVRQADTFEFEVKQFQDIQGYIVRHRVSKKKKKKKKKGKRKKERKRKGKEKKRKEKEKEKICLVLPPNNISIFNIVNFV